jgi:hypothetical protein
VTRAWCLFELYTAIGEPGKVEIDIILTESEQRDFVHAMATDGCKSSRPLLRLLFSPLHRVSHPTALRADICIDKALNGVHSAKATASRPSDLDAIRALIQSKPGGFEVLDSTVKRHLGHWFEGKGAVRSAERVRRSGDRNQTGDWSGGSERMAISPSFSHGSLSLPHASNDYLDVGGAEALQVGHRCTVKNRGAGVVRFVGEVKQSLRIGVALDTPSGLNDGTFGGTRYFECPGGHGVFAKPENVQPVGELVDVSGVLDTFEGQRTFSATMPDDTQFGFGI